MTFSIAKQVQSLCYSINLILIVDFVQFTSATIQFSKPGPQKPVFHSLMAGQD